MYVTSDPFLDLLYRATQKVREKFPKAELYEADQNTAETPDVWRFVYNVPPEGGGANTTAIIVAKGGQLGPVEHVDQPWLEDRVIPLPIPTGLTTAERLARAAGFDDPIAYTNLRWPLYPGVDEPLYVFAIPGDHVRVYVGVYTHRVTTQALVKSRS